MNLGIEEADRRGGEITPLLGSTLYLPRLSRCDELLHFIVLVRNKRKVISPLQGDRQYRTSAP